MALDPGGNPLSGLLGGICRDCMFLYGSTYLTFENGSMADIAAGVYNHHVAVGASGISTVMPFSCTFEKAKTTVTEGSNASAGPRGPVKQNQPFFDPSAILDQNPELAKYLESLMQGSSGKINGGLLFGSGDDGAPIDYASRDPSLKTGLYIGKKAVVSHYTEVINYRNFSQVVYITAEVEYIPGRPKDFHDASMGAMSATGCGGVGFCKSERSHLLILTVLQSRRKIPNIQLPHLRTRLRKQAIFTTFTLIFTTAASTSVCSEMAPSSATPRPSTAAPKAPLVLMDTNGRQSKATSSALNPSRLMWGISLLLKAIMTFLLINCECRQPSYL
jgi:hypothetical protein